MCHHSGPSPLQTCFWVGWWQHQTGKQTKLNACECFPPLDHFHSRYPLLTSSLIIMFSHFPPLHFPVTWLLLLSVVSLPWLEEDGSSFESLSEFILWKSQQRRGDYLHVVFVRQLFPLKRVFCPQKLIYFCKFFVEQKDVCSCFNVHKYLESQ